MQALLHQILSGLANGGIYASIALALVMIYRSTHHVNFAQGEMAMFSTYVAWMMIQGGSAGGLLMGAVVNMRPELFRGVIAGVPYVDVITTMMDSTIPLTTGEYDEWGNPHDSTFYRYMLSYSPYDNVARKAYPNLLITAGLYDTQVLYVEPAKWTARLRAMKTDSNRLILRTNMEAGHGGASGRYKRWHDVAFEYAFFVSQLPQGKGPVP